MKNIIMLGLVVLLTACENGSKNIDFSQSLPDGFKDCKVVYVYNKDGEGVYLARCPNSTTTVKYNSGKTTRRVITVDGVEYEAKEK